MKHYNILYIIVFVIISAGVLYLSWTVLSLTNENRKLVSYSNKLDNTSFLLKNSLLESVIHTNSELKPLVKNIDSIYLRDIITKKTVVFVFFENSCSTCLQREMQNIKKLESQNIPTLLITSAANNRVLSSLVNRYDLDSPAFLIPDNELLSPGILNLTAIYYFVLDEKGDVSLLFFPVQYEDQLSEDYLGLINAIFTNPSL